MSPLSLPQSPVSQLATSHIFLGGLSKIAEMVSYHLPCHQGASPWTTRRRSLQARMDRLIQRGFHPPGQLWWGPRVHNGTQWGAGTSEGRGALLIRLVRTWVQIQTCPRRQKGRLITSQIPLVIAFWGWIHGSQVQGVRWKYCAVWVCESVSLRHSPAAKQVRSPDPQVCGKFIRSRVSPNRASGLGFIQTH
jgi:hypothetical protein